MTDVHNLERFFEAQRSVYADVVRELSSGRKRTHWMWFIFPQIAGLGQSEMSRRFAISSREEAAAYERHALLGTRLRECTQLVISARDRSIAEIFGHPDELKFHSSMTLFSACAAEAELFDAALRKYFDGMGDSATIALLGRIR